MSVIGPTAVVVAPRDAESCLVLAWIDGELREHGPPVPLEGASPGYAVDGNRIALLDDDGKRLRLLEVDPETWTQTELPLPVGFVADSVATADGVMFVGGHSSDDDERESEKLFVIDLHADEPDWIAAPMWYERAGFNPRKSIDALFIEGYKLLAVDDFVIPRYSLVYEIEGRTRLSLAQVVRMQDHTSYESVRRASLGPRWLAVFSAGVNHGTWMGFLALLERDTLLERSCYQHLVDRFANRPPRSTGNLHAPRDLAFVGEILLIAAGEQGLGLVDLRSFEPASPTPKDRVGPGPEFRYRSIGDLASVDRVLVVPGHDVCVCVELREHGEARIQYIELTADAVTQW